VTTKHLILLILLLTNQLLSFQIWITYTYIIVFLCIHVFVFYANRFKILFFLSQTDMKHAILKTFMNTK